LIFPEIMAASLLHQNHPLAAATNQLRILESVQDHRSFTDCLKQAGLSQLRASETQILQVNLGKVCNQTCSHCHVDAGPDRRESMSSDTVDACLRALAATSIPTLDITGGAPELNPNFRRLVTEGRRLSRHVIDRCNLTILTANGFEDLPEFLADHHVEVVASLPCYLEENCDSQRGTGVFRRSIESLRRLNERGYARPDSGLVLTLVFNPIGPRLPPPQRDLELAYRNELRGKYGVQFSRLHTITNMPINRFLDELLRTGQYETYMQKLVDAFNPATVENLMCRTMVSVDWRGYLYDCDFNQMLELPIRSRTHIRDFDTAALAQRAIVTAQHCFGCTAGNGSSCQGSLAH
jgi:radical SAM/Cys-rich protein